MVSYLNLVAPRRYHKRRAEVYEVENANDMSQPSTSSGITGRKVKTDSASWRKKFKEEPSRESETTIDSDTNSKDLCDDESSTDLGENDSYSNDDDENMSEDESDTAAGQHSLSFEINPDLFPID